MATRTFLSIFIACTILVQCVFEAHGSRVLFMLPVASKSHVHVFEPLIQGLSAKGHEVVNLSPIHNSKFPKNVKTISAVSIEDIFHGMPSPFEQRKLSKWQQFSNMSMDNFERACKKVLDNEEVLNTCKEKFDVVIVDTLLNYCVLGLLPTMNTPYIYVSTMVAPSYMLEPLGTHLPSSFVPSPFLEFSDRMTFRQRLLNFVFNLFLDIVGKAIFIPKLEKIFQQKLGIDTTISEIDYNASMVLVNSHHTLTYPRPYLPDVVEVGGMHCRSGKPLPKDLDEFVSGAKDGLIFFSLGSIAQGKDMPESARLAFVKAFSKLKQRVLWKWEADTMPDLPPNVKVGKWLPQQDILAHKNTKLFITHGGLLSIQEAVYHGVPLLGIPLFADQDLNIKQAVNSGFALFQEILEVNAEILETKLKELLENPQYSSKAKELSTVWKDQPVAPLDAAIFWVEHVIRQNGATHLRSGSRELNMFQYYSLDVMLLLCTITVVSLLIIKKCAKLICRKMCGSKSTKNISTKKKQN